MKCFVQISVWESFVDDKHTNSYVTRGG